MGEVNPVNTPIQPFDVNEFRSYGHQMVDFLADYYERVETLPVRSNVKPGYLRPLLPDAAPEKGESLDAILQDVQEKIVPGVTHWQSPNFFAYFPSNSSTAGLLGEMLSGAFNIVGFSWISSPAATELETLVLDWMAKLIELPSEFLASSSGGKGGGVIQGTASEAVLVSMLAARTRIIAKLTAGGMSQSEATAKLVAYTSDQAHSCVQKACMIANIEAQNFRALPTDKSTHWALSPGTLAAALEEDKAAGKVPFFLCATVGTTSTTAVDPVEELGILAQENDMWMHVDAAYAGSAAICPEFRPFFKGLDRVDSFCFNAHKWLLTNFDCSMLWFKDARWVKNALSLSPEYLRNKATEANMVVDYKDWQIPLGRRFRSLKLWMVLRLYGVEGLQAYIRRHVALAEHFEALVRADDRFEIIAPRTLALVCFCLVPPPGDVDNGKALNATLMESLNSSGAIFLTHTVMSGIYTLRMAIGGTRTEQVHVDKAWRAIQAEASRLLKEK